MLAVIPFFSQAESWSMIVLYDEISIEMPMNPDHKVVDLKNEVYTASTGGCSFMIGIAKKYSTIKEITWVGRKMSELARRQIFWKEFYLGN